MPSRIWRVGRGRFRDLPTSTIPVRGGFPLCRRRAVTYVAEHRITCAKMTTNSSCSKGLG